MKKISFLIYILLFLFAVNSCQDNAVEPDAIPMTIEEMANTPGYLWIWEALETYQADTTVMSEIAARFDPNRDRFLIFSRAACSCPTTEKSFTYIIKIFRDLGLDTNVYELYAMTARANHHPYEGLFTLNELPAIIYLRNGTPYYSLIDTLDWNIANNITYPLKTEELLLEALKKQ
ncbi:MAG: hypothetical protein A2X64_03695 [Ignavibacteria bacterium GWF2_33_9]|nr:MAG: hypothetical protein A2X64_03695 [Ignavibacteria bacterium GWF2_33_9]